MREKRSEVATEESVLEAENTEPVEGGVENDEITDETPEESIRQAIKEIEAGQGDGGEGEEAVEPGLESKPVQSVEAEKGTKKAKKEDEIDPSFDPDTHPPERFKPHEKAWFNKIPQKGLKQAIHRSIKEMEGAMTRATQEASAREKEAGGIMEAVKPYIDQFTERNLPISQGIAALCLAQKKLTDNTNPKLQRDTWLAIGKDIGIDTSVFEGNGEAQNSGNIDISTHPVIKELRDENNRLRQLIEPVHNANKEASDRKYQEDYNTTLQDLESVVHESDSAGNLKRPELSTNESFLQSWKAQVSALVGTAYGKNYKDAGVNAYRILKGLAPQDSNQLNQPRIPAANNTNNRAVSAATSVRGRNVPHIAQATLDNDEEIPANETPAQSVQRAMAQIARG